MRPRVAACLSAALASVAGYLVVSRRVAKRETRDEDAQARDAIRSHVSKRAEKLAEVTGHIGKWYVHVPLAVLGGGALAWHGRLSAGAALATVSLGAAALSPLLDRVHAHHAPPPGKHDPSKQSFPSGHALETTAVGATAAYLLARERLVPAWIGGPAALVLALVSGVGRLVLDRHWISDSAAGYLGGVAVASVATTAYEASRA